MSRLCHLDQFLVNWTNVTSCHVAQALQTGSFNSTLLLAEDCANQACANFLSALAVQNQTNCSLWDNVTGTPWPLSGTFVLDVCLPKMLSVSQGGFYNSVGKYVGVLLSGNDIALIVCGVLLGIWIIVSICRSC
ncbi:hypothetical protein Ae201684P_012566 [Aphanomyces euteiches]|nr:hypothetical protein Ae201684P_012566 [Aphanomyces euteiches]